MGSSIPVVSRPRPYEQKNGRDHAGERICDPKIHRSDGRRTAPGSASTGCMVPVTFLASMVRNTLLRPNLSLAPHSWRWAPRSRIS